MTEHELIERAIESAKCRIYRVQANSGSSIAHQKKADEQAKLQVVTIKALEKQIPKKPIIANTICKCPTCASIDIEIIYENGSEVMCKHCPDCGQKLDWGNEDAE